MNSLYYIANARMPTEKAHGIQIAKMCEAFIESGVSVTLVVPRRKTVKKTLREFYGLRTDVPVVYLPTIDVVSRGGYVIQAASFAISSFIFSLGKRLKGDRSVIYTVDMDTFSSSLLPLSGFPVFSEMHNGKPSHFLERLFFRHLKGAITINRFLKDDLQKTFPKSRTAFTIEPNAVDAALFTPKDKVEARKRLGLSNAPIILYVGRFFAWKGLEVMPDAAEAVPGTEWILVGGTKDAFVGVTDKEPSSQMTFVSDVSQSEIPWWLSAADVLLVIGTRRDRQSWSYTSPMKLFEYLCMERPVVATATPAIQEIVSGKEVLLSEPEDSSALAFEVKKALAGGEEIEQMVKAAQILGLKHSWRARATRIVNFMDAILAA